MAPLSAANVLAVTDTQALTFSDRLSVNGVPARRSKSPLMSAGVARVASSDMFKTPGCDKPKAKRWDHRLNIESKSRKPSTLKEAAQYLTTPGLISLGGGLPSSEYFPFERIDIKVPNPPHFSEEGTKECGIVKSIGKYDTAEGKSLYDMHVALNYGQATGSAQILRFVTEHTEIVHNPPYQDWHCTMTIGSTSALDIAYRMFTTRGEYILAEEYTFPAAIETATPLGLKCVGVNMDAEGLLPSHMDSILTNWDPSTHAGAPKPWLLYTVPSGQNPTGATQGEQRRREIYRVAQKHDIFILEDEPYYFLQMQPYTGPFTPSPPPPSSHEEFLKSLVPSFLSMDVDGRVMRMDSFSKVIAPGTRMGWITASEQIVERYVRHSELSTQHPSGISQIVLYKLLEETWGHAGYLDWLINLRMQYTRRRDNICYACEKFLPREVASWKEPAAGMFHWIKINWTLHPQAKQNGLLAIEDEIFHAGIAAGVLYSKGTWFRAEKAPVDETKPVVVIEGIPVEENEGAKSCAKPTPNGTISPRANGTIATTTTAPTSASALDRADGESGTHDVPEMFFRVTFAAEDDGRVSEAIRRFGDALRGVFGLDGGG